jgi:hypothetical protein
MDDFPSPVSPPQGARVIGRNLIETWSVSGGSGASPAHVTSPAIAIWGRAVTVKVRTSRSTTVRVADPYDCGIESPWLYAVTWYSPGYRLHNRILPSGPVLPLGDAMNIAPSPEAPLVGCRSVSEKAKDCGPPAP